MIRINRFLFYIFLLSNFLSCSQKEAVGDDGGPGTKTLSTLLKVDPQLQSNMVIQQNSDFYISGEGTANQYIYLICSWNPEEKKEIQVSNSGVWNTTVRIPSGSFIPHTIKVEGKTSLTLTDILIGEVWLCSGQSNMWYPMKDVLGGLDEMIKASNQKEIRLLNIQQKQSSTVSNVIYGTWQKPSSSSLEWFSAVGYFFAKQLRETLNVPIGIINASWGDTTAEVWAERNAVLQSSIKDQALVQDNTPRADNTIPYKIGHAYNAMIYPLRNIPIKGAIWYQGESNMDNPNYYPDIMTVLVNSWRSLWKKNAAQFPVYLAQICPYKRVYDYKTYYANPNMRYAQQKASKTISNSGVICNDDIGDIEDIHARNKKDVGIRFAKLALKEAYNHQEGARSPIYDKMTINGDEATVEFLYANNGLKTRIGDEVTGFEIAGTDKIFFPAQATIIGSKVVVKSVNVPNPVAVRLGWSYTKITNLVDMNGYPVSVFKTYDWAELQEEQ